MMIMMLYPIHQSYGRFTDGLLLSMEKTKLLRNIQILCLSYGPLLSYYLIAPRSYYIPGLELGATGLAIKLVLEHIIAVNIRLYYCCKILKQGVQKYFYKQVTIILPLFCIGYLIKNIIDYLFQGELQVATSILSLVISGIIYGLLILLLLWVFPNIADITRQELNSVLRKIKL